MACFLLVAETLIFLFGFLYLFKRDIFFGVYYFFLFVYGFFAQVGYFYKKELSAVLGAYFGEDAWYPATELIILSLAAVWFLFMFFRQKFLKMIPIALVVKSRRINFLGWFAITFVFYVLLFEVVYLLINFDNISWYTAQDETFVAQNPLFGVFIFVFKLMVAINLALYCVIRSNAGIFSKSFMKSLLAISLLIFMFIAFRLGNRTDVIGLSLGAAVYEFYQIRFTWKIVLKVTAVSAVLLLFLSTIESLRYTDGKVDSDLLTSILLKDYYAPAHMLFAAVHFSYVDPLEVLSSNFKNALILFKYPYLQYAVSELFRPGLTTRSSSYAFYLFTEGYLVMGMFGFIYNAFIVMTGLSLWRRLAMSNSKTFNLFLLGLMGCMLINLVRGQSSYFIKYLYTFVLPGVLFYLPLAGQKISVVIGRQANLQFRFPQGDP